MTVDQMVAFRSALGFSVSSEERLDSRAGFGLSLGFGFRVELSFRFTVWFGSGLGLTLGLTDGLTVGLTLDFCACVTEWQRVIACWDLGGVFRLVRIRSLSLGEEHLESEIFIPRS